MGRRAKHLTLTERSEAKRSQQAKYKDTERGKSRRAAQSRVRYASRCGHFATPFPKKIKGVAPAILAYARKPFGIAIDRETDDSYLPELGLYTRPYKLVIPPQYSIPYTEFDELFTDIGDVLDELRNSLNSRQFGLSERSGRERYGLLKAIGGEGLAEKLREEITLRSEGWDNVAPKGIMTQVAVAQVVGTEWAARIICCLTLELRLIESSVDQYERAFKDKSLHWQRLHHSITQD